MVYLILVKNNGVPSDYGENAVVHGYAR